MNLRWIIPMIVSAAAAGASAQPAPLTDSQRTRLETADDRSTTVDESAFYALLENARDWPESEVGAVVPNLDALREQPERWRGRLCLIEGTLEMAMGGLNLSRSGWEGVGGLVLRPDGGEPLIVYLTEPPELHRTWISEDWLEERGSRVRIAARFYKLLDQANQAGEPATYLTFVGRRVSRMEIGGRGSGGGLWLAMILAGLTVAVVFYLFFRANALRKRYFPGRRKWEEFRHQREARRQGHGEPSDGGDDSEADLPQDPAEALDILSRRHPTKGSD